MATFTREYLSHSVDGKAITLGTSLTNVHTTVADAKDEVYLWVTNTSGSIQELIVSWGGSANPADRICHLVPIPPNSPPVRILDGQTIGNGKVVQAACNASATALIVSGHVNRIQE